MLTPYAVSYFKVKQSEEVLPSELTSSVEKGELEPPMISLSPPSPPTFQHRWSHLLCLRVTEVLENSPVEVSRRRQEVSVSLPPQRRLPHIVCRYLPCPGMSGSWQWWRVLGLQISTWFSTELSSLLNPPVIMKPAIKCIYHLSLNKYSVKDKHYCHMAHGV